MLSLSQIICTNTSHYVDGLFFGHVCSLLAVMMVYKYWDSITKEDLEFSVGGKLNVWEVKEDAMTGAEEDFLGPPPPTGGSGSNTPRRFGDSIGVGYEKKY